MSDRFAALRRLCLDASATAVVPGAVVLCADEGRILMNEAFGARQIVPSLLPATTDTIYDVASLTKALVTSVLVMRAVAAGRIELDAPIARYVPEFLGDGKSAVTVRHLLCHASGLPAHRPLYLAVAPGPGARESILGAAAAAPLVDVPGRRAVYSDLGFMLLGWALERTSGLRLDVAADREIVVPLGLRATGFVDLTDAAARPGWLARGPVAPTESCADRGHLLLAEVHDQNAFAMGGVAGHAGLFSTAADVAAVAEALCRAWSGSGGAALVEREVVIEFWRTSGVVASMWRLGWDGPAPLGSQAGQRLSRAAVGHLGFTGCSLWIEPKRARWIVTLTNRVHPTVREDPRFRSFRAALQDAAVDAMEESAG